MLKSIISSIHTIPIWPVSAKLYSLAGCSATTHGSGDPSSVTVGSPVLVFANCLEEPRYEAISCLFVRL